MTVTLIRDYALIFLVVEVTAILAVLLVVALKVLSLVSEMRSKMLPLVERAEHIVEGAEHTVETVQGRTNVVNDAVVSPVIKVVSYAAGASRALKTLTRGNGRHREV